MESVDRLVEAVMEEEEEDGFEIFGRHIREVNPRQDGEGAGNHHERCAEVRNSGAWVGVLILVDPMLRVSPMLMVSPLVTLREM